MRNLNARSLLFIGLCLAWTASPAVAEMVRMITVQRAYEAAQHAITAQDETLGKAVNEVSRV